MDKLLQNACPFWGSIDAHFRIFDHDHTPNNEPQGRIAALVNQKTTSGIWRMLNRAFHESADHPSSDKNMKTILEQVSKAYQSWISQEGVIKYRMVKGNKKKKKPILSFMNIDLQLPPPSDSLWQESVRDLSNQEPHFSNKWLYVLWAEFKMWSYIKQNGREAELMVREDVGVRRLKFGGFEESIIYGDPDQDPCHFPGTVQGYPWTYGALPEATIQAIKSTFFSIETYHALYGVVQCIDKFYGDPSHTNLFVSTVDFWLTAVPSLLHLEAITDDFPDINRWLATCMAEVTSPGPREKLSLSSTTDVPELDNCSANATKPEAYLDAKVRFDKILSDRHKRNMDPKNTEVIRDMLCDRQWGFPQTPAQLKTIIKFQRYIDPAEVEEQITRAADQAVASYTEKAEAKQKQKDDLNEVRIQALIKQVELVKIALKPYRKTSESLYRGLFEFGKVTSGGIWSKKTKAEIDNLRVHKETRNQTAHGADPFAHADFLHEHMDCEQDVGALYGVNAHDMVLMFSEYKRASEPLHKEAWDELHISQSDLNLVEEAISAHFFVQMMLCDPVPALRTQMKLKTSTKLPASHSSVPLDAKAYHLLFVGTFQPPEGDVSLETVMAQSSSGVKRFMETVASRLHISLEGARRYPDPTKRASYFSRNNIQSATGLNARLEDGEWLPIMTFLQFLDLLVLPSLPSSLSTPLLSRWKDQCHEPSRLITVESRKPV